MQSILRWLAEWKGFAVEPGAELRLELAGLPDGGVGALAVLGLVVAIAIVVFAYRRDGSRVPASRRAVLAGLRALVVLGAWLMLLEPTLVSVKREVRPGHSILLLDTSQSMGHRDSYRDPAVGDLSAAWRDVLGDTDPAQRTRIDLASALLRRNDGDLLEQLAQRNEVRVYGFSSALEPIGVLPLRRATADGEPDEGDAPRPDLGAIAARGRYSNLGGAVRRALERSQQAPIASVLIVSDGRRNVGPLGPEVARLLEQRKVPHTLVLPVGDPSPTRTLTITRIDAPDKAFQRDPFTIRAFLESQGHGPSTARVSLKRQAADQSGDAITIRTEDVSIGGPGNPNAEVVFDRLRSDEAGLYTYVVEVDPPSFEAPSPERHVLRKQIEVLGEQTRVLLIAGGPTPEYRTLRTLLTRDKSIEVACWLCSADSDFPQDGNVTLESLPTEPEELEAFDVMIFLDPDPRRLERSFCEAVAREVDENGAGVWWIAGEKFTLHALREDASTWPIGEILPIVPDMDEAEESVGLARGLARRFRYELTPVGEASKVARIVDDRGATAELWSRLPGFHFAFPVRRPKPAAQVLVEHRKPTRRDPSGSKPMVASHFLGSGRVLFTATDDTYRWRGRFRDAYERYWVKGIRYLFEGRLDAGNSRLRILLDEEKLELGQALSIAVEARTANRQPVLATGFDLVLRGEDGGQEPLRLAPVEGVPGRFEVSFRPTTTGYFRVTSPDDAEVDASASFQVVPAAVEREGPVDLTELGAIANVAGGQVLTRPLDWIAAASAVPSATKVETFTSQRAVWDTTLTVLVLVGLLAVEWWLRKRSNLL